MSELRVPTLALAAEVLCADGRSLIGARTDGPRLILSETFGNILLRRWHVRFRRAARAVLDGDLKLIVSTPGKREAYDLASDPGEVRDLFADEPRWRELQGRLDRWLRDAARSPAGERRELDEATEEHLRSLGYL